MEMPPFILDGIYQENISTKKHADFLRRFPKLRPVATFRKMASQLAIFVMSSRPPMEPLAW